MITITDTPVLTNVYVEPYRSLVMQATLGQVEAASIWYFEAQEVAEDVAELLGKSLEVGASVVSSFSPRERWASNVAKAYAFANGKPVTGLTNNITMANNSLEFGFNALKGAKTNAFARAIAGDSDAIVIDVWMCKAANVSFDAPNKTQYREMSEAVSIVASEFGITPRTAQALIWIVKRGSAS